MQAKPDVSVLYNRATESGRKTREGVVAMSTASIGVFFFALTTKVDPALTSSQRTVVLCALVCMAFTTFAGLWSAWADARWSYAWARELEDGDEDGKHELEDRDEDGKNWILEKDRWHARKNWGERYSLLSFSVGVLLAGAYVALRAL